jgi:hypothetical protein
MVVGNENARSIIHGGHWLTSWESSRETDRDRNWEYSQDPPEKFTRRIKEAVREGH